MLDFLTRRHTSVALLVLGYVLTRCLTPVQAKPAHSMAAGDPFRPEVIDRDNPDEACSSGGEPCAFALCPGDIFRAVCDQFALLETEKYPLRLTDVGAPNTTVNCAKADRAARRMHGANSSTVDTAAASRSGCHVTNNDIAKLLRQATKCFTSPECIIKHPETLEELREKFCDLTTKILNGYYYCN